MKLCPKTKCYWPYLRFFEQKLKAELEPIKKDIVDIKREQSRINVIIEHEIRKDESESLDSIRSDVELLKRVVSEHSERLNKTA